VRNKIEDVTFIPTKKQQLIISVEQFYGDLTASLRSVTKQPTLFLVSDLKNYKFVNANINILPPENSVTTAHATVFQITFLRVEVDYA